MSAISADNMKKAYVKANENNYVSKGEVVLALLEKGQHSIRYKLGESWELNLFEIQEAIDGMPTVDMQPVHCGEWLPRYDDKRGFYFVCSNCSIISGVKTPFCFECGANMQIT